MNFIYFEVMVEGPNMEVRLASDEESVGRGLIEVPPCTSWHPPLEYAEVLHAPAQRY